MMATLVDFDRTAALGVPRRLASVVSPRPWGRRDLGPWGFGLGSTSVDPVGEVHHHLPGVADPALFVKTLFTAERLSVQVHPDAAAARRLGLTRGKDEAWVVLAADPGATIGLGLKAAVTAAQLEAAALDGSITDLMIWHPCAAGDVFFAPAGSIHAIGGGITLFEVQQNLDLTYRLFDYGRGRELHLAAALAVADLSGWTPPPRLPSPAPGRELLVEGPGFVLERLRPGGESVLQPAADRPVWLAIIDGSPALGDQRARPGETWFIDGPVAMAGEATILLAYEGPTVAIDIWQHR